MTDQQKQIYSLILKKDVMTLRSVVAVLKISEEQAQMDLEDLVDKGLIKYRFIFDFYSGGMVKAYRSPLAEDDLIIT